MPQGDDEASTMKEALIHAQDAVIAYLDTAEVLQPSIGALDFPAPPIAAELAFVFKAALFSGAQVGSDQLRAGDEYPIEVLRSVEQLILLVLLRLLVVLPVTDGDKAVGFAPTFRLVPECALRVGVGLRRGPPSGGLQPLHQSRGLARHHDEFCFGFLVGLHRFPAIEPGIRPREDAPNTTRQGREHLRQVTRNLLSVGPVAVA